MQRLHENLNTLSKIGLEVNLQTFCLECQMSEQAEVSLSAIQFLHLVVREWCLN